MTRPVIYRCIEKMVHEALVHECVGLDALARSYLVDMLVGFIETDALVSPGKGFPTLAMLHKDAVETSGIRKMLAFKRLGDTSLFLSGIFADYVRGTVNGLGYYVDMGRNAYGSIATSTSIENPVFAELSKKFMSLVVVLNSFAAASSLSRSLTLDGMLELYVRDGANLTLQRRIMNESSIAIISTVGSN